MSLFNNRKSDIPRRRGDNRNETQPSSSSGIFKRNRTLTGSTSVHLNIVNANSDLESTRVHSHRLTITRRKVSGILLVTIAASAISWFLISHLTASVVVGTTDSAVSKPIEKHIYEKVIQEYLDANPLSRLSFLLDGKNLTSYVSAKLPEVSSVIQGGMAGIGGTNFVVKLRTPVAGWKINGKQFYVDSSGIPFERNYYSSQVVQIVDNSGIVLHDSSVAIASKRFLAFVGRVVYLAKSSGYTVTKAVLPPNTTRELELQLSGYGFYVKLSIDRSAGEQVEDMTNAIRYFVGTGQSPQYIDVRVSGKAFYR